MKNLLLFILIMIPSICMAQQEKRLPMLLQEVKISDKETFIEDITSLFPEFKGDIAALWDSYYHLISERDSIEVAMSRLRLDACMMVKLSSGTRETESINYNGKDYSFIIEIDDNEEKIPASIGEAVGLRFID